MSANEAQPPSRIVIVDDEAPARLRLRALLEDVGVQFPHVLVGEAADGHAALELVTVHEVDIALLDVQMPGMTGIELARHLGRLEVPPAVIFVTAFDEFALEAFDVHALDYLLKPVRAQKLVSSLERAARWQTPQRARMATLAHKATPVAREFVAVHERGRLLLVPVASIVYFKAELKYVTIRTAEKQYLTEESLVGLEEEFSDNFVRVHRNALIAREALVGCERVEGGADEEGTTEPHWEVLLKGIGERLPVSRRQWPIVKALLKR
ncbi:MAG: LytTR family DNA-binding domain-containing protein [Burkholderiaceae bacterium]|jgi:two-component system response regulator AlgR